MANTIEKVLFVLDAMIETGKEQMSEFWRKGQRQYDEVE